MLPSSPGPSERSNNMRAIRRKDTKPERQVRSLLHASGLRFRVDLPLRVEGYPRTVRPDIAFTRARLAVFIDGCFWHGCPVHGQRPHVRNGHYWKPKLAGNAERDRAQTRVLEAAGWTVLRFWEHQNPEDVAAAVRQRLRQSYATASADVPTPKI